MKRVLLAPISLSILLVGCGLSSKEKKAYESEISLLQGFVDDSSYIDKLRDELNESSKEKNYDGYEIIYDYWKRAIDQRDNRRDYISCIKRYMGIKEPFAKARTACIAETGIDR